MDANGSGFLSTTRSFDGLLLAGLVLLAFQLLGPVLTIPLHIPVNYNEGWNAALDTRAVTSGVGPLYPPPDSFLFNNYPPLGFYLVGWFGRYVFGDMIVAGRVIALLSLIGAATLTGLCVRDLGGRLRAGLAAGLLMLLYVACYFRQYVAVDDPQWLAHAIMLGGLAVLLRDRGLDRLTAGEVPVTKLVGAALLVVAAGFVKHNLIALPGALTVWLIVSNRRAAAVWIASGLVGLAIGALLTALLHGDAAFADVLHHRRVFRAGLMKHAISALAPLLPMAAVAIGVPLLGRRRGSAPGRTGLRFVALFGSIAFVTGVGQRMGEGVYYNAHFETLIAVCLGLGLAISPALEPPAPPRRLPVGPVALCCFAALPILCAWPWHLPRAWADIHDRSSRAAAWQPVIARIAAVDGPVGCLMASLCWWAGKPSEVDMFNLTEKSVVAGGPLAAFRSVVARQRFALFQDDPKSFIHNDAVRRLGFDPVMSVFANTYAPVAAGPNGVVLLAPIKAGVADPR